MPATEPQLETPSATRLVIRVKLTPREPPQPPPARRPLSKSALLSIVGAVAVVLGWLVIGSFRSEPTVVPEPAANVSVGSTPSLPQPATQVVAPEVQQQPDPPPSPINEALPDVPQSALDTIRGTVRVSVRVTFDKQGTVVGAAAEDRGPSRYFERLAVETSKKWTFTPANSEERRTMLVRFNFTRAGVSAHAISDLASSSR